MFCKQYIWKKLRKIKNINLFTLKWLLDPENENFKTQNNKNATLWYKHQCIMICVFFYIVDPSFPSSLPPNQHPCLNPMFLHHKYYNLSAISVFWFEDFQHFYFQLDLVLGALKWNNTLYFLWDSSISFLINISILAHLKSTSNLHLAIRIAPCITTTSNIS